VVFERTGYDVGAKFRQPSCPLGGAGERPDPDTRRGESLTDVRSDESRGPSQEHMPGHRYHASLQLKVDPGHTAGRM
jgi:hypothetical protein